MAWTIQSTIDLTRHLLQDEQTPYRTSNAKLVSFFNHAQQEIMRLRPELYAGGTPTLYTSSAADLATAFPIDDMYVTQFSEFMVGMTELSDDEFTNDNRAAVVIKLFQTALIGA